MRFYLLLLYRGQRSLVGQRKLLVGADGEAAIFLSFVSYLRQLRQSAKLHDIPPASRIATLLAEAENTSQLLSPLLLLLLPQGRGQQQKVCLCGVQCVQMVDVVYSPGTAPGGFCLAVTEWNLTVRPNGQCGLRNQLGCCSVDYDIAIWGNDRNCSSASPHLMGDECHMATTAVASDGCSVTYQSP